MIALFDSEGEDVNLLEATLQILCVCSLFILGGGNSAVICESNVNQSDLLMKGSSVVDADMLAIAVATVRRA